MNYIKGVIVLAAFVSFELLSLHALDYSDLQALGAVCTPNDRCESSTDRSFYQRNCECDSKCSVYNDCCIDAQPSNRAPRRGVVCLPESPERGVYVLGKCNRNWIDSSNVRNKCHLAQDNSDPMLSSPLTDIVYNITYKNHYCAICNYADTTNLRSWLIKVDCPSLVDYNVTQEFIQENLTYKTTFPHRNKWGVYAWNENEERPSFHPCKLSYVLPQEMEDSVRFCRPNLISTCSPTWRRVTVARHCQSYMAVVVTDNVTYRNPHCALCNRENLTDLFCPISLASRRKAPMSMTLILDVNLSDGNKVGEVNPCNDGEIYDSFFKKCRKLICAIKGYRLSRGKCVPGN